MRAGTMLRAAYGRSACNSVYPLAPRMQHAYAAWVRLHRVHQATSGLCKRNDRIAILSCVSAVTHSCGARGYTAHAYTYRVRQACTRACTCRCGKAKAEADSRMLRKLPSYSLLSAQEPRRNAQSMQVQPTIQDG